jgi:hypothetical protein
MTMAMAARVALLIGGLSCLFGISSAFTTTHFPATIHTGDQTLPWAGRHRHRLEVGDDQEQEKAQQQQQQQQQSEEARRSQEMHMEQLALSGADKIAKMNISERTKRAMLAEAVEDRISDLTDELEALFDKNTGVLPESNREDALDISQQTKVLQSQYKDLVSGGPSPMLQSLESATSGGSSSHPNTAINEDE